MLPNPLQINNWTATRRFVWTIIAASSIIFVSKVLAPQLWRNWTNGLMRPLLELGGFHGDRDTNEENAEHSNRSIATPVLGPAIWATRHAPHLRPEILCSMPSMFSSSHLFLIYSRDLSKPLTSLTSKAILSLPLSLESASTRRRNPRLQWPEDLHMGFTRRCNLLQLCFTRCA